MVNRPSFLKKKRRGVVGGWKFRYQETKPSQPLILFLQWRRTHVWQARPGRWLRSRAGLLGKATNSLKRKRIQHRQPDVAILPTPGFVLEFRASAPRGKGHLGYSCNFRSLKAGFKKNGQVWHEDPLFPKRAQQSSFTKAGQPSLHSPSPAPGVSHQWMKPTL